MPKSHSLVENCSRKVWVMCRWETICLFDVVTFFFCFPRKTVLMFLMIMVISVDINFIIASVEKHWLWLQDERSLAFVGKLFQDYVLICQLDTDKNDHGWWVSKQFVDVIQFHFGSLQLRLLPVFLAKCVWVGRDICSYYRQHLDELTFSDYIYFRFLCPINRQLQTA